MLSPPIAVTPDRGDWPAVRACLSAHGSAAVYGELAAWSPDDEDSPALRAVLGRDWPCGRIGEHAPSRRRYIASRLLLKHTAAAALRAEATDLEMAYGLTGRPSVWGCDQIDLSLSHSDALLLVGLTSRGRIGVDAERADRQLHGLRMARSVCTPGERNALETLPEEERNDRLVCLWTLKEAYTKAIGQGMRFPFTAFGFDLGPPEDAGHPGCRPPRLCRPDGTPCEGTAWSFRTDVLHLGDVAFRVSTAVRDAGLGRTANIEAATTLDPEIFAAVSGALAEPSG
ncbi:MULTISPECIES: 4'-phosphopantetheinyl transferase family protein [Streptomyces]|uniref:4'-phosphopantetheinyl transferase family protein n=1 Tax=Streptomyces lycopersici TaxID=2974589 RepID=UPI0021D38811|nr:4'-phosphopantetheinyl transferase superfamily protein [Streptomyces sp. NEAU-383]